MINTYGNTKKYKLSENSLISSQKPPTSLSYIGHLLTTQRFRIQDFYSYPERKWWDSYIMGIFHFRCSSCISLDSCMQLQYRWRHLVAVWWTNWSHVTIPYFEQGNFYLPLPNNSLNKFNLRLLIFFWCLPFRGLMHYFPKISFYYLLPRHAALLVVLKIGFFQFRKQLFQLSICSKIKSNVRAKIVLRGESHQILWKVEGVGGGSVRL